MTQFYIVEVQQYQNGEFGHLVHYAWDENADKARLKAESKYYEVLSAAEVSELPSHAAILFGTEGFPLMNQCYKHTVVDEPVAEPVVEETPEPEPEPVAEEPDESGEQ